jgi:hypothetical protein
MSNGLDANTKELLNKLKELDFRSNRLSELLVITKDLADEEGFPDSDEEDFPDFVPGTSQPPGATTVGIPKLPPGATLDLTLPTIQLPDVPEFKIPDLLSVPGGGSAVIAPGSLSTEDWIVIAKNNNILRAYTAGDPPDEQSDPPTATTLALDYVVPKYADFFEDMHLRSEVRSEVTYSGATASYVRAGFDKQSASLSIPYAAASFERQSKEREAKASNDKTIYMIGSWHYPRAKLYLKKFTKASTRFTAALEAYRRDGRLSERRCHHAGQCPRHALPIRWDDYSGRALSRFTKTETKRGRPRLGIMYRRRKNRWRSNAFRVYGSGFPNSQSRDVLSRYQTLISSLPELGPPSMDILKCRGTGTQKQAWGLQHPELGGILCTDALRARQR